MTVTEITQIPKTPFEAATFDLYRDIHKGIRGELFGVTQLAGRLDPSDHLARVHLAEQVHATVELLVSHAEHEDRSVQPAIELHLPDLAAQISSDHERLEARLEDLDAMALDLVSVPGATRRPELHLLYVELASFTSSYLVHQDLEERAVMPSLEAAIGLEAVMAIHADILAGIPPQEMAASLAVMLPAMNIDDRAELLGGMQASAPAEVFTGVWALAGSVLPAADHAALADRLGLVPVVAGPHY